MKTLTRCTTAASLLGALATHTASTAAATPWCTADSMSLSATAPPAPNPDTQSQLTLILTNVSTQTCTLQGYPDVDLLGPDDPMFGPTYRLPQQAGDPQPLTLAPHDTASAILTFLPGPPTGWIPTTIAVTAPHSSPKNKLQTPWIPAGTSVLRQDAGTHPGTYIGPLQQT
ncbi:DUF4232 domain-containing protein [Mycobacterium angelicum]|uniref:DUF4232 domain-containing protein n=1 Tax=Mycobacterium angelicum TaxID=470074 RepID=A0A1W9ZBC3_MYCAN|nr:DUF4232 domain-containing protein [Mycobacterium angelicum]MCV7196089.1 DUF4232 domain-containing protein [Mycobacterium angelicum]ORA11163.1 hypothetical protein BST12_26090 [Mycobacterium angelicum]